MTHELELTTHEEFMRLFVVHQSRIYAFIRSLVFNRHDAEDILQEVVTVLWRRYDEFEPGTRFDSWAFQVAFNQVRSYRQRKQRDALVFDEGLAESIADAAASAGSRQVEIRDALDHCLNKLPKDDKELLEKRFQPGATNREVAKLLERSESAISRNLRRIYRLLMGCIQGPNSGPQTSEAGA